MPDAIVLFAHGARDPAWARPFEAIAGFMRERDPATPVVLAYLELMQPRLAEAVAGLVEQGARRVRVVPLFLGAGGHVRRDLPELLDTIRAAHAGLHPGLQLDATPAIGESAAITCAIAQAAWTLVAEPLAAPAAEASRGVDTAGTLKAQP
jgi:sirohydrochlorin cobaltochelatase